jgi:hypothetical protein
MFMHPHMLGQLAAQKHRDMLAQAERDRLASQVSALARASRRAERAKHKMQKAARLALRLRSELGQ